MQGPSRPHLPEEDGGNPQASYAYAAASADAKQRGTERSAEVQVFAMCRWHALALKQGFCTAAVLVDSVHERDAHAVLQRLPAAVGYLISGAVAGYLQPSLMLLSHSWPHCGYW